jgi:general secretion pathway protein M
MAFDLARQFPTAERGRQQALMFWQGRSRREQLLLAGLGAILLVWLLAVFVVGPLQTARAEASAKIRTYESLSNRLRLAGSLSSVPQQAKGPPATILASSGAQYGISPMVTPDGTTVRVAVVDASYDGLLRWIAAFEQSSNLRVVKMRLDRRPATGVVSADLTVAS